MCSRVLACARGCEPRGGGGGRVKREREREKEANGMEPAAERRKEEAGIRFSNRRYISTINIFVTYRFSARATFAYAFRKSFVKYVCHGIYDFCDSTFASTNGVFFFFLSCLFLFLFRTNIPSLRRKYARKEGRKKDLRSGFRRRGSPSFREFRSPRGEPRDPI